MDDKQDNSTPLGGATPASSDASKPELALLSPAADQKPLKASEATMKKHKHHKKAADKKKKKGRKHVSSSDSSASSTSEEEEEADSEDETESSSDDTSEARTQKKDMHKVMKKMMRQLQKKTRRGRRTTHNYESSSSSESEASVSDDDQDHDHRSRRRNKSRRNRHRATRRDETIDSDEDYDYQDTTSAQIDNIQTLLDNLKLQATHTSGIARRSRTHGKQQTRFRDLSPLSESDRSLSPVRARGKRRKQERDSKQYKRIDEIWDNTIHNYRIVETAESREDEYEQYVFTVRRTFDWENRPKHTTVDVRSKYLRDGLKEVLKDVKGLVLDTDKPVVDPNILFLYLDEIRQYNKALKIKLKRTKKRKELKKLKKSRAHCKVLIDYLDEDYKDIKKTLKGLLKQGEITFELLWAIFKPNCIAYTSTYGSTNDPRCFKVDYTVKCSNFMRGEYYCVEGRYLEYDGKSLGLGDFSADVDSFKGPRKITSLECCPLHYHKDVEGVTKQLVERGKKFVALEGMSYKAMKGMAYMKKKKGVAKININGRVMVDGATFRRINPNYLISPVKIADDEDGLFSDEGSDYSDCCGGTSSDEREEKGTRKAWKAIPDKDVRGKTHLVQVEVDANGETPHIENIDELPEKQEKDFTQEDYLIASPVVLGFAFSEKLWLEFSVSSIKDIEWNEGAFESLVLPDGQKSIVKALVESHKYEAARTIDDVVQGKGKGLVAVLHGSPGTGKTLTAEGIAELLKCPLYMVSVGELGTEPARLEEMLNRILDMAHTWGALILLDEADVFLERRQTTDIHRNALVSVFLRLLEYFQGILFLTTNRVEEFDPAFQSRIHLALKYGELTLKARTAVWKTFLGRIRDVEDAEVEAAKVDGKSGVSSVDGASEFVTPPAFTEADYDVLARRVLNGRQIKNAARTAQALALNEGKRVGLEHVKKVLEVQEAFEHDLKGGTGFVEAMRSYT